MHTGKQKHMNAPYQAPLVNRHIRRFTGVCMYLCWVWYLFGIISRTEARSATNEVPKCMSPERALLRENIIGVRLLTSTRRAKLPK